MKYAVVFACTAALVSALQLPLPQVTDKNNQVNKQPAQGQLGNEKSCEEQGGTVTTVCFEDEQLIDLNGLNGLIPCCLPKTALAQGQLGNEKKSCEEQGGTVTTVCFENEQSINYNGLNGLISCCLPKAAPAQDQKASPESASAQGPPGDEKSCVKQGRD
ncbi:hypothetical protein MAJ_04155, partial [Metarhizium majus ARSEF 297]